MNYLAHLFLSPRDPLALTGALAGDFVHGRVSDALPERLRGGILLHRAIDAFADSHPAVRESRMRLAPFRHHARIIVDVFYDHLLARDFVRWSGGEPLEAFAARAYGQLRETPEVTPRLSMMITRMIEGDWLTSYREVDSIERALFYLSRRLKKHVPLNESVSTLISDYEGFAGDFGRFADELMPFAKRKAKEIFG